MYTSTLSQATLFAALFLIGSNSLPQPEAEPAGSKTIKKRQEVSAVSVESAATDIGGFGRNFGDFKELKKGGKKGKHTGSATGIFTDFSTGTGFADFYDVKAAVVGGVDSATGTSDNVIPTATATGLSKLKLAKRQAYSATTATGLDHSTETGTGTPTTAVYTPSESGMGTGGMPSGMPTQGSSPEQWMECVESMGWGHKEGGRKKMKGTGGFGGHLGTATATRGFVSETAAATTDASSPTNSGLV